MPSTIASLGANTFTALQTLNGGFSGTTGVLSSTMNVAGATTFNTVAYTWPGSQGAVDTFLKNNGSGTLSWGTQSAALPSPVTQNLIFTDNTYDIGASGATRPRNYFGAGNMTLGGTLGVTGASTITSLSATSGTFSTTLSVTGASTLAAISATSGSFSSIITATGAITSSAGIAGTTGTFSGNVTTTGGIFTGTGANNGLDLASRDGSGARWIAYNPTGDDFRLYNTVAGVDHFVLTNTGLLTVSGFGTHTFSGGAGSNGANILDIANAATGTAARSIFRVLIDGNDQLTLTSFSSGYTTSGANIASSGKLDVNSSAGLSIVASHASGAIRFYSGGTTLRAEFTSDGLLSLNPSSTTGAVGGLKVITDQNSRASVIIQPTSNVNGGSFVRFHNAAAGTQGEIYATSSSATVYATSSDARLKNDLGLATDLSLLRALRIHDYTWKSDGSRDRNIFAQEAYAVSPRGIKRGTDGSIIGDSPWSFEKATYVPDLIVGWQQHDVTIQKLTARITALESRLKTKQ